MKYLTWFFGFIVVVIGLVYSVAFTSFGNSLLSPIIQSKIKEQTKIDLSLSKFKLDMSEIDVILELSTKNTLHVEGSYSLFSQSFNLNYNLKLGELETLRSFVSKPISGSLNTNGNILGDMKFLQVNGKSDLAKSITSYHVELTDLNPTSIIAKINNLQLDKLLELSGEKKYASAEVDLDINFKSIKTHALNGDITLKTKDGRINSKLMKDDFSLTIPKTAFSMNLNANLKGDEIKYDYKLLSNLFKITSSGDMTPKPLKTNIKYNLNIQELALLKPITDVDLNGKLKLDGSLVGAKDKMIFKAKTNIAYSDTSLHVVLNNFAPTSIKADMKNLRLEKALKMLNQAPYSDGLLSLHVDVSDARTTKLKGNIKASIEHGLLNSAYLSKTYEFKTKMPKTTFELNTDTTLDGNNAYTNLNLNSSLAKLDMKKLKFNIKTGFLNSDYVAKIPNLDKLFFVTNRHMRGAITLNGDIAKENNLDLTMHTQVAKGKIDAKLHNDDFHADLIGVDTIGLLHMLKYPELFQAKLDARLDYNLAMSKGVLDGDLIKGHFVKNKTFDMIKQYAKFNMYKEKFSGDLNAKINKENILSSLNLKSNSSAIITRDTKLNTKTQQIDSKLKIVANKNPIDLELSGDVNQPNIKIDLEKFMKSRAGDKVKKELNRFFKKLF